MTQRNPMNERYQNTEEKKQGKTRKSAASAKPVTKAASSVRIEGPAPKPQGRLARAQRRAQSNQNSSRSSKERYLQPATPEYKKWRRIWWILILGALIFTTISFFSTGHFETMTFTDSMLGVSYVLLVAAIVLDVTKIRKIRKAAASSASGSKSKAETARRKEEKAKAAAAQSEKAKAAADAESSEKKGRGLFGRKK